MRAHIGRSRVTFVGGRVTKARPQPEPRSKRKKQEPVRTPEQLRQEWEELVARRPDLFSPRKPQK